MLLLPPLDCDFQGIFLLGTAVSVTICCAMLMVLLALPPQVDCHSLFYVYVCF